MRPLFFLAIVFNCLSIEGSCQVDTTNLYLASLKEHLVWVASNKKELRFVYVEKNELTTESLPNKIGEVNISYLNQSEVRERTRKGEKIYLIVVKPIRVERESLKVTVIDFSVTSKKHSFNYANGGGSTFEFRYNCDQHRFELVNKKQSGI